MVDLRSGRKIERRGKMLRVKKGLFRFPDCLGHENVS